MFKDECRYRVWEELRQLDLRTFQRFMQPDVFQRAADRAGVRMGCCALSLPTLVWLGVSAALHSSRSFAEVLSLTVRVFDACANPVPPALAQARRRKKSKSKKGKKRSKHDPHGKDPALLTEEAFVGARRRMPLSFWINLLLVLTDRFEAEHGDLVRWKGFRILALDGTTVRLPKDRRLADHFGTAKNGKARCVQARMVMLQLPLARLPWRYELCSVNEGERTIAARLLQSVCRRDLVLMDQGFWSYGLFHQVQKARAFFAIRLSPHIKLHTIKRLGPKDRWVRWKKPTGPRWRGLDLPESIELRVVDYQIPGFRPSAVVTNVLDPHRISREQWVRLTTAEERGRSLDRRIRFRQGLYHRRWEIETTFHELKVIQGLEGKLRSRTPESIQYEVAGHVLLYLLVRWLMVEAAGQAARDGDPLGISFKHAMEELLTLWSHLTVAPPELATKLVTRLLERLATHQVHWRPGRHFSRPHDTKTKNCGRGKYRHPHKLTSKAK